MVNNQCFPKFIMLKIDVNTDKASIVLKFMNGSNGVINYFSNGHRAYPKERIEVFYEGKVIVVDNFRRTEGYGFKGFKKIKSRINKGHREQFTTLVDRVIHGGESLIPFKDIINTTQASIAAIESSKSGAWVTINDA